jgi:hypothetical protein
MTAVDVHHHYVPKQLIEETKRHGKVLGVDVSEVQGRGLRQSRRLDAFPRLHAV